MQNYSSFTDSELSYSLIEGDRLAFDEIYLRYWRTLHQKACRILNDEDEAADIIQEVFVSLWQRRTEVKVANLKAYLNQAVKFSVLKAIRENKVSEEKCGATIRRCIGGETPDIAQSHSGARGGH